MGYYTQGLADKHLDQYIPIGSLAIREYVSVIVASQAVSILNKSSLKKNFLLFEFHIHKVSQSFLIYLYVDLQWNHDENIKTVYKSPGPFSEVF